MGSKMNISSIICQIINKTCFVPFHWDKDSYYDNGSRGAVDQQWTGTQSSHGHDVGSKSSPKHGQEAHEDERPEYKDPCIR